MKEILHIENLSKSFGGKRILDNINLSLFEGENLVIMGKSGIGKSVLIKCIVRLIDPDSGVVKVFGEDILGSNMETVNKLRRNIGFVFQGGALYDSMSVKENLEFPLTQARSFKNNKKIRELVNEALENVGLLDALHKMPSELSGGMIKRIGLARTLILKPKIIFYDEPTTGLDPITGKEIIDLILEVQKKYQSSSIIITHDIKCARLTGDRITILQDAKFIAEGNFEDLKASKVKEISSYFN